MVFLQLQIPNLPFTFLVFAFTDFCYFAPFFFLALLFNPLTQSR